MISLREMTPDDLPLFRQWLSAPHVARWYQAPQDWIAEVEDQDGPFRWLHHFIVQWEGEPVGFCQYYACRDSGEPWGGYTALGGTYSIDYLIGESGCLRRGLGRQMVAALEARIRRHGDARRVVVQPDRENRASRGLLRTGGYLHDSARDIFVKDIFPPRPLAGADQ